MRRHRKGHRKIRHCPFRTPGLQEPGQEGARGRREGVAPRPSQLSGTPRTAGQPCWRVRSGPLFPGLCCHRPLLPRTTYRRSSQGPGPLRGPPTSLPQRHADPPQERGPARQEAPLPRLPRVGRAAEQCRSKGQKPVGAPARVPERLRLQGLPQRVPRRPSRYRQAQQRARKPWKQCPPEPRGPAQERRQ